MHILFAILIISSGTLNLAKILGISSLSLLFLLKAVKTSWYTSESASPHTLEGASSSLTASMISSAEKSS